MRQIDRVLSPHYVLVAQDLAALAASSKAATVFCGAGSALAAVVAGKGPKSTNLRIESIPVH